MDGEASVTLRAAHKEHEGVYAARLRTRDGVQEHSAFVYVEGEDHAASLLRRRVVRDRFVNIKGNV